MEKIPNQDFSVDQEFLKLQKITEILREMGFRVWDKFISEDSLKEDRAFPIVKDGMDGIRAVYEKRRGLKIFFTNGFENPENERRKEVEERLKEVGL